MTKREGVSYMAVVLFIPPRFRRQVTVDSPRRPSKKDKQPKRHREWLLGGLACHKTWKDLSQGAGSVKEQKTALENSCQVAGSSFRGSNP